MLTNYSRFTCALARAITTSTTANSIAYAELALCSGVVYLNLVLLTTLRHLTVMDTFVRHSLMLIGMANLGFASVTIFENLKIQAIGVIMGRPCELEVGYGRVTVAMQ